MAEQLWNTGIHEARILAAFVDEPEKVTRSQMERWARDLDSWDVCDLLCANLFDQTPFAYDKCRQWSKRKAEFAVRSENTQSEARNRSWDPRVRAAEERAREQGRVAEEDGELLAELEAARDPSITVCAPSEFGYIDDSVCRSCPGYAECAARRIRMAADVTDD